MANKQDLWPAGVNADMVVTWTQTVAGTLLIDISPGIGNEYIIQNVECFYTGTNAIQVGPTDGAGNVINMYASIASAVNPRASIPDSAANTTTSNTACDSTDFWTRIISGRQTLRVYLSGNGSGTDTFLLLVRIRIMGASLPTITDTGGTGTWGVTAGTKAFQWA